MKLLHNILQMVIILLKLLYNTIYRKYNLKIFIMNIWSFLMMKNRKNFFLFLNLALVFTLVGMIVSFFIFRLERIGLGATTYEAHAQSVIPEDASDNLKGAILVQNAIREVTSGNMAAVVNISTESKVETPQNNMYQEFFGEDLFKRFFGEQQPQEQKRSSLGSGFIVDKDGYVLSNYHVVKGATKIMVRLYNDDKEYPAELIGFDEMYDLALLKIEGSKGQTFPSVRLGDSDNVSAGDFGIAIGNPFGLNNTVTFGIISSEGRSDIGSGIQNFIQVDTAINPGNSGGPLFNIYGEVIGVNTMIYSTGGGNIGIGFATPINIAKRAIPQLRTDGKITRGYLGIYPQDIDSNLAEGIGVEPFSGVYVSEVVEDSPAEKAGLNDGDIITDIEGQKITRASQVFNTIAMTDVGKTITIKYIRDGKERSTKVKIEERIDEPASSSPNRVQSKPTSSNWLGMGVSPISEEISRAYNLRDNESGVVVTSVARNSKAATAGIRDGDIIKGINGKMITDIKSFEDVLSKSSNDDAFTITLKRSKMTLVVNIK